MALNTVIWSNMTLYLVLNLNLPSLVQVKRFQDVENSRIVVVSRVSTKTEEIERGLKIEQSVLELIKKMHNGLY